MYLRIGLIRDSRLDFFTRKANLTTSNQQKGLRGWRKYIDEFKDKPASHIVAFAILHEITAILPLPVIYYALQYSDLHIPIPDYLIAEANKKASKLLKTFGLGALEDDSKALLNMATSYAIVKVGLPARIGLSFLLTPWFARRIITPITGLKKVVKNYQKFS